MGLLRNQKGEITLIEILIAIAIISIIASAVLTKYQEITGSELNLQHGIKGVWGQIWDGKNYSKSKKVEKEIQPTNIEEEPIYDDGIKPMELK